LTLTHCIVLYCIVLRSDEDQELRTGSDYSVMVDGVVLHGSRRNKQKQTHEGRRVRPSVAHFARFPFLFRGLIVTVIMAGKMCPRQC
jgi:hypothetical protein